MILTYPTQNLVKKRQKKGDNLLSVSNLTL